jgi:glycosyltransferase involved in cell wall biosynthesis
MVAGLIGELARDDQVDATAYALTWRGRHDLHRVVPRGVRAATAPIPARLVRMSWLRTDHPHVERWTGPIDVVHATNYVAPPSRAPVVVSVYDLGFVRYPELCNDDVGQYPELLRRAFARGAFVHATSDFVANEVVTEFGLPPERVRRVYPGVPATTHGSATRGHQLAGAEHYILFLGTVEPRKNLPLLVDAFDELAAREPNLHLVIVGPDGWGTDQFNAARERAAHASRIRRLGYVSDEARRDLLAGAAVLAYPSHYEGFGFPPLEAMSAGVPVVASRAGAIPEVTGDAALLVEPDDRDAFAEALERTYRDAVFRDGLVARGREQAETFTWAATARDLVDLYQELSTTRAAR